MLAVESMRVKAAAEKNRANRPHPKITSVESRSSAGIAAVKRAEARLAFRGNFIPSE